jgi:hypothetical protein
LADPAHGDPPRALDKPTDDTWSTQIGTLIKESDKIELMA